MEKLARRSVSLTTHKIEAFHQPFLRVLPVAMEQDEPGALWQDAIIATKFFVPGSSHSRLSRPRLITLLDEALQRKLTLISAPAGFGKTTLASAWVRSIAERTPAIRAQVAWISLDKRDNDPLFFWTTVLTALEQSVPSTIQQALALLHTQPSPSLSSVLITLINQLVEIEAPLVIVLDDYQVISEPAIHAQLSFLLKHQPPSVHLLLLSRTDPPLSLPRLRARDEILEVRAEHLRVTLEETRAFVKDIIGIELSEAAIEKMMSRTEGWLTGLHLFGLCLQSAGVKMVEEVRGDHHYILDYLVEEVLQQQPPATQDFLLRTSILEELCAPLCDAIMEKTGSQDVLKDLEDANVFIVPLDGHRQRYRYHGLFVEALRSQLERQQADEVEDLHVRASIWYAEQGYSKEAIQHALLGHAWQRAADLIEREYGSISGQEEPRDAESLRQWLDQIPEAYIRVCPVLEQLLGRLKKQEYKHEPILYVDTMLTAFSPHEQTTASTVPSWKDRPLDPLSTRELEVLQLMVGGSSNREIAERLVITVDTVKRHVSNILGKLQANNRTQAVAVARMFGLLKERVS